MINQHAPGMKQIAPKINNGVPLSSQSYQLRSGAMSKPPQGTFPHKSGMKSALRPTYRTIKYADFEKGPNSQPDGSDNEENHGKDDGLPRNYDELRSISHTVS